MLRPWVPIVENPMVQSWCTGTRGGLRRVAKSAAFVGRGRRGNLATSGSTTAGCSGRGPDCRVSLALKDFALKDFALTDFALKDFALKDPRAPRMLRPWIPILEFLLH